MHEICFLVLHEYSIPSRYKIGHPFGRLGKLFAYLGRYNTYYNRFSNLGLYNTYYNRYSVTVATGSRLRENFVSLLPLGIDSATSGRSVLHTTAFLTRIHAAHFH